MSVALEAIRKPSFGGGSITIPLKEALLPHADELSEALEPSPDPSPDPNPNPARLPSATPHRRRGRPTTLAPLLAVRRRPP